MAEALACLGLAALLLVLVVQPGKLLIVDARIVPIAGILLLLALAFVGLRPWSDPLGGDVRAGRVESVFGVPQHSEGRPGLAGAVMAIVHFPTYLFIPRTHVVSVGDKQFVLSAEAAQALPERQAIRAYYLPGSMTLISIAAS